MSNAVSLVHDENLAVIRLANPPVNALGHTVRQALFDICQRLKTDGTVQAVVIVGDGRCFSAGADISEFGTEPPAGTPTLPETISALEDLSVPVIAGVHGFAFGGGLELAMGAHYRIAHPDTTVGLTEVDLGIIPGAGGTQRLPRLIGLKEAAALISGGQRIGAGKATDLGIFDALSADDVSIADAAIAYARSLIADNAPARATAQRTDKLSASDAEDVASLRASVEKKAKGRIAPLRAIESVMNAAEMDFDAGMRREREIFLDLRDGPEARAMRHLFRAERAAAKIDDLPDGAPITDIRSVGIVGFGTMGQGIALAIARAGLDVIAVEVAEDRLDAGLEALAKGLADRVARGRMSQDAMDAELGRISGTTNMHDLADVDMVIEAAIEDMDVKKSIFRDLDSICRGDTILATNTSSLDIDEIAAATGRPELVAGAHFFAPAQVMKLLELVRGSATSPHTMGALMTLAKKASKVGVAAGNAFSFIANRMYHRYTWQAYFMLQEGAEPAEVDAAMQDFGFPLGCLAVGDMSGLDVAYHVRKAQRDIGDIPPDMPYPVVADRIVEKGWLGRKTGQGWYDYTDGKPTPSPAVSDLIFAVSDELDINRRKIDADEIRERCLFALINEGATLLGRGVASRPGDIDVIWRYGYGFPVWRGGPMFMADDMGLDRVLETLKRLASAHGPHFNPAPLIEERAAAGKTTFVD